MRRFRLYYFFYGVDDRLVAGAAAVIARDMRPYLFAGWLLAHAHQVLRRHQHAGRAEPALQRIFLVERLLQLCQLLAVRQALDGFHPAAIRLDREHQAAAHNFAVDAQRARAADAVLAADVRAGQPELIAQEIDQVLARLDAARHLGAVYGERDY